MFNLIRLIFWVIIILIIFAVVPSSFWDKLKPYINLEKFISTIKLGFQKLSDLFTKSTGLDLSKTDDKIKDFSGINLNNIWNGVKGFFSGVSDKIEDAFKRN